ncbi:hypothetical protein [Phocaeicola plebeius]|jgi:hypothetical protein|uniref:hypothetical protein n=1 Tax=Phocaeicola plebeius TaxID=310297 RepID=UPI003F9757FB
MAIANICPYCGGCEVSRTVGGWVEESAGKILGNGFGILVKTVVPVSRVNTKGFSDVIPTQYKCKRCGKTFHVISVNGKISILNDDTPEKIAKVEAECKAIQEKLYKCVLVSIGTSKWDIFNTKRLIWVYTEMSFDYISKHLPCEIVFKSKEDLDGFKKDIITYHGKIRN